MSREDDKIASEKEEADIVPLPEPPPGRVSSANAPAGATPPRFTRFGEGAEGNSERRQRGLTGARANFFERIGQFINDVRAEMRRVSWPTANEVKNTTIVTLLAVVFFAVYLYVVDQGLVLFITQLERLVNWLFGAV